MKHYYQCLLRQGDTEVTAWIESRGAKVGAFVEVRELDGLWEVVKAHKAISLSEEALKKNQKLNRGSLPSVERMGS